MIPVILAGAYHEWLYLFFAAGAFIFSPIYHFYKITNLSSLYFRISEKCDVLFATGAFAYMYYYTYYNDPWPYKIILHTALTLAIVFYLYGRRANYPKLHPWFHVIAATVSSAILVLAH